MKYYTIWGLLLWLSYGSYIEASDPGQLLFELTREDPAYDDLLHAVQIVCRYAGYKHASNTLNEVQGTTYLMVAARRGHAAVAKLLLYFGADVNAQNRYGWNALMEASEYGKKHVVDVLLQYNVDVNAQNKNGWTPLMVASKGGHAAVVKKLLQAKASIRVVNVDNMTCLDIAERHRQERVAAILRHQD